MSSNDDTHGYEEDSMLLCNDNKNAVEDKEDKEATRDKQMDEAKDIKKEEYVEEIKENGDNMKEQREEEVEDKEQGDPFAEQKAKSIAAIDKIAELVAKIEETVTRHKTKAECRKLGNENPLVYDKQLHRSANTNRYDTGVSSEFLMKQLMQLDNCLSYGCASIKKCRKAMVRRIEQLMVQADSLSQQWLKRAQVFEKLKAQLVCPSTTDDTTDTGGEDQAIGMTEEEKAVETNNDKDNSEHNEESEPEMDVEMSDGDMEEDANTSNNKTPSPTSCTFHTDTHADFVEDNEISGDNMEEDASTSHSESKHTESTALPSWRPRAQMYRNGSHVVVAAFVPGMDMEQFNIMVDGANLVVRAKKKPTWQEFLDYQRGLAPRFGSLDLKVPLPVDVVYTEGATATYENDILRVKFIKKQIPQQSYHRPSPQQHYRQPMRYRQPARRRRFLGNPMGFW